MSEVYLLRRVRLLRGALPSASYHDLCQKWKRIILFRFTARMLLIFLRMPKKLKKGLLPLIDFFTHSCMTKKLNVCTDYNPMYAWSSQFNHGIEPHFVRVASNDTCTQVIIISHMTSINNLNRKKILTLSTWCQFKLTQSLFIIY